MHPAHLAFQQWLAGRQVAFIGQVCILFGQSFELRHVRDQSVTTDTLTTHADPFAARELALRTDDGKFRPLKSAPNLDHGWRIHGLDFGGLTTALDCFYPAAIVHWHAWQSKQLEITSYRAFAARQTGMYRITTKLSDNEIQRVAACCCAKSECLKRPLWNVDDRTTLSLHKTISIDENTLPILCPEPCSLLLSFARKAVRLEQEETMDVKFTKSELALIGSVLRGVLDGTEANYREGDYNDPRHRQRIQYLLKKHEHLLSVEKGGGEESDE